MNFSKNDLIFLPLGGSGEIGMNCNLYHFDNIDYGGPWSYVLKFNLSSNELSIPG